MHQQLSAGHAESGPTPIIAPRFAGWQRGAVLVDLAVAVVVDSVVTNLGSRWRALYRAAAQPGTPIIANQRSVCLARPKAHRAGGA